MIELRLHWSRADDKPIIRLHQHHDGPYRLVSGMWSTYTIQNFPHLDISHYLTPETKEGKKSNFMIYLWTSKIIRHRSVFLFFFFSFNRLSGSQWLGMGAKNPLYFHSFIIVHVTRFPGDKLLSDVRQTSFEHMFTLDSRLIAELINKTILLNWLIYSALVSFCITFGFRSLGPIQTS